MKEKVIFYNKNKEHLTGDLFIPDKLKKKKLPAVMYVHGLLSSRNSRKSRALLERLYPQDFIFFRFDSYGRGDSYGDLKNLTLTKQIDCVDKAFNTLFFHRVVDTSSIFIIGSSFGGLAALLWAANDNRVRSLALVAPALNLCSDKLPDSLIVDYLSDLFYEDLKNYNPYEEAEKINCPVLVVHGKEDIVVPVSCTEKLPKHLKNCIVELIDNADHLFESEESFNHVINSIDDFIQNPVIDS
ncbi:MAG: alpha/beta fold hydrolase [Planctomycetota bacterium]